MNTMLTPHRGPDLQAILLPEWPQELVELDIDLIDPDPGNPRGTDPGDDLNELAISIAEDGLLAPIRVRPSDIPSRFTIEIGFRRFKAHQLAGKKKILCIIDRRPPVPLRILTEQIAENLHRSDIKPCRFALALKRLQDLGGFTLEQTAAAIHRTAAFASRKLALLKFTEAVQEAIDGGRLDESTAVAIATIRNEQQREALAQRAIRDKLTRAQVDQLVASLRRKRRPRAAAARPFRRLSLTLPGGSVAVASDAFELTTEIIRDTLEFALQHVKKAIRKKVAAAELPAHFQQLAPPAANTVRTDPAAAGEASAPLSAPAPTAG